MAQPQLIMAIGRIERALSRIEQVPRAASNNDSDGALVAKHERLKSETKAAISELDNLIARNGQ